MVSMSIHICMPKFLRKNYMRIGYTAGNSNKAQEIVKFLKTSYKLIDVTSDCDVDIVVVIGGDGCLLHALHKYMHLNVPFYGINAGSIGFLMNQFNQNSDLIERLQNAEKTTLKPLEMQVIKENHDIQTFLAVNEVSLFRATSNTAKIAIKINGIEQMSELISDGVLVSTSAGSTAYNLSAGGSILPLNSNVLALTPICPFRPRRWRGAIIPSNSVITFSILGRKQRPVHAVADFNEYPDVETIIVKQSSIYLIDVLFDLNHKLEDRIIKEQFSG